MREETIIRRLQSGDPAGLEALMERYIPYVSAVVWNILRDAMPPEDGEEAVSNDSGTTAVFDVEGMTVAASLMEAPVPDGRRGTCGLGR